MSDIYLKIYRIASDKAFTLIELMIVIAIIGILAAIAVPQFTAFKTRAYNAAAKVVVDNFSADQANLRSELGVYGHTDGAAAYLTSTYAAYAPLSVPNDANLSQAATEYSRGARIVGMRNDGKSFAVGIVLGENMIAAIMDTNSGSNATAFISHARHIKGDTAYAIDSNIKNMIFSVSNAGWIDSTSIGAVICAPSIGSVTAINGQYGAGSPYQTWARVN